MKPKYTCSESKNVVTLSRFMLCSFAVNTDPTLDTPDDDLKLPDGFRPQLSAPPSLVELPANLPQLFVLTRLLIDDYSYPGKLLRNWVQGSATVSYTHLTLPTI